MGDQNVCWRSSCSLGNRFWDRFVCRGLLGCILGSCARRPGREASLGRGMLQGLSWTHSGVCSSERSWTEAPGQASVLVPRPVIGCWLLLGNGTDGKEGSFLPRRIILGMDRLSCDLPPGHISGLWGMNTWGLMVSGWQNGLQVSSWY